MSSPSRSSSSLPVALHLASDMPRGFQCGRTTPSLWNPRTIWKRKRFRLVGAERPSGSAVPRWERAFHRSPALGAAHAADPAAAAIDLAQLDERRLGDVAADDLVGLAAQLLEVDPGRVGRARALGDDSGLDERLDQHAEDVGLLAQVVAPIGIAEGLEHGAAHPAPVEAELPVDLLLLLRVHEVEEEGLEAARRPVLDPRVLLLAELRHRSVGPDLPELVVEGLVGHDELHEPPQQGVAAAHLEGGEGPHREALDQHLHTDELLVDLRRAHDLVEQRGEGRPRAQRRAPARGDVAGEARDVARLLARLVRRVLLGAGLAQDLAQARGERERALLAMEDARDHEARVLVGESDLLALVEPVGDGAVELDHHLARQDRVLRQVEALRKVDVARVLRVPEVVLGGRDDRVEGTGAGAVAVDLDHRREVVALDGVVDRVVGDVVRHAQSSPLRGRGCVPESWMRLRVRATVSRDARVGSSTHHATTRASMPTSAWDSTSGSSSGESSPAAIRWRRPWAIDAASSESTSACTAAASPSRLKRMRTRSRCSSAKPSSASEKASTPSRAVRAGRVAWSSRSRRSAIVSAAITR